MTWGPFKYLNGLMQDCSISIANVLEILQPCTKPYLYNLAKSQSHKFCSLNYLNPICWVATLCHQVCCMYWRHFGHLHRAISNLNWYEIVCMEDLASTFSQMKSMNMFSMYLQSGIPQAFPLKIYCRFNIEPHCFHAYVCQCWPQTLAAICRNMGVCDVFTLCPPGEIYLGFIILPDNSVISHTSRQHWFEI